MSRRTALVAKKTGRAARSAVAVISGAFIFCPACGPLEIPEGSAPTLNSTVINDSTDSGEVVNDLVGNEPILAAGSVEQDRLFAAVTSLYCCNPYEREFRAVVDGSDAPVGANCSWRFGDGHSAEGCVVRHVFAWEGTYKTVLHVTLADETSLSTVLALSIGILDNNNVLESLTVDAGEDLQVMRDDVVRFKGTVFQFLEFTQVELLWRQVGGTLGTLTAANTLYAVFEVPPAAEGTTFVFTLTAQAGDLIAADQVTLTIVADSDTVRANDPQWGFDPADATGAIQNAINSGAATVVIPDIGQPWIVRPIQLRSNLRLVLESGVVLKAKPGAYPNNTDSVLSAIAVSNVSIEGDGATIRMQREEYSPPFDDPAYIAGEWRHAVNVRGARQIQVTGLTIDGTGGDGIYISPTWDSRRLQSSNVTVRDCTILRAYRNGISIISGENILVDGCYITATGGTPPQSSVHIETESYRDRLINVEGYLPHLY